MIDSQALDRAQEIIGYTFRDRTLLTKALTHASVADSRLASNERLEFLGDSVLGVVVCAALFEQFPEFLEGDLTKLKSVVVSRKTCAEMADLLGLTDFLILGKGMNNHPHIPMSLRAAVFESIVGAIFLDGGFEPVRDFILKQANPFIDETANSGHEQNHKSMLQQHVQKSLACTPHYIQLDEQGPDHSKCFEMCVSISSRRFPAAWGPSKKEAEQKAAHNALQQLLAEDKLTDNAEEDHDGDLSTSIDGNGRSEPRP